ncbi:MAG: PIG-L family deacetylase [Ardenticatenales bacterium]|nr:PIG-L family deacetylase [Ardenticatenales bacterium]
MSSNQPQTLLAILAHPDDESFGPGGTLAKYAAQGVKVHICIVTDGAAGSTDPEHIVGYESLAHRRADELQGAIKVLGATLHTLPYRDSGMEGSEHNENPDCLVQAPLEEVACHIVRLLREVKPQVVLTHDPTGGYFHPDHIRVNQAVELAWEKANDPAAYPEVALPPWQPQRLFWTALPRTWLRRLIWMLRLFRQDPTKFGRNKDIDITRLGTPDESIHCRIDVGPYLAVKHEASRHHLSQGGGRIWGWMPKFIEQRLFGSEVYTQARPDAPRARIDFFEGL